MVPSSTCAAYNSHLMPLSTYKAYLWFKVVVVIDPKKLIQLWFLATVVHPDVNFILFF